MLGKKVRKSIILTVEMSRGRHPVVSCILQQISLAGVRDQRLTTSSMRLRVRLSVRLRVRAVASLGLVSYHPLSLATIRSAQALNSS